LAAKNLTEATLRSLKPEAARREIPDGKVPNLYLVMQPSGARSWALRYRHEGKPRKLTLDGMHGLQEARAWALELGGLVAKGEDPAGAKANARAAQRAERTAAEEPAAADPDSVAAVVDLFLRRHVARVQNARSAAESRRLLDKFVLPAWRDRKLADIRRRDVHDLLDSIVDGGAPTSANRTLSLLKVLWSFALDREIASASPVAGFKPKHREEARDRVLSDGELVAIWRAADALDWPAAPIVKLLALTGQRRDEVAGMRWAEVDLDGRLWSIPPSRRKGGIPNRVPLSDAALAILEALPRFESDWVFPARPRAGGKGGGHFSGYSKAKARLDQLSGVTGWRFHDLRRTLATRAQKHYRIEVVEAILGHISGSRAGIIGVYQLHKFEDETREALAWWARRLHGLLEPQAGEGNVVALPR
jgi:integrase